jgi:flagellin-like protein
MKPSNLFNSDDRAVSPVIGVILMVAITVILAAVIGTFVLGLGDSLGDSQPTAQINIDTTNENITFEHSGGDRIDAEALTLRVQGNGSDHTANNQFADAFTVGDQNSFAYNTSGSTDADVRIQVIHTPSDSVLVDRTVTISGYNGMDTSTDFTAS